MSNVSFQDALRQGAGDSPEYRAIQRAVAKAKGDRPTALRNVARLYHTAPTLLPQAILTTVTTLLAEGVRLQPETHRPQAVAPSARGRSTP